MSTSTVIRSPDNALLKQAGAVVAGRERDLIALEGDRLVDDALAAQLGFDLVLVSEEREKRAVELEQRRLPVRRVAAHLLDRVSDQTTSPGIQAQCARPQRRVLEDVVPRADTLALVVSGIADPGNLGALARSAEAAGCTFLALVAGGCSPWNGKALRGSMGSLLRLPVLCFGDAREAIDALALHRFRQVSAATRGGTPLASFDWSGRVALWIGAESGALPGAAESFERVTIPMAGRVESLNVAVAASLLLFAAGRASDGRT
jgi:TrmH family RNA methyltransferase